MCVQLDSPLNQLKGHYLLQIHGFVPLGPQWDLTDVLVSGSQWRTLPNLMRGKYGQSLLAAFFEVDLHVMQQWIQTKGYSAEPQGYDLALDVNLSGQLRVTGFTSDWPTTVDCLMQTKTGRMLVRSELTGESMQEWDNHKYAREAVEALSSARASRMFGTCYRGCFTMIGVAMGLFEDNGK